MKKLLTKECEKWAKEHGGTEFASDCELFNGESLRFHLSMVNMLKVKLSRERV